MIAKPEDKNNISLVSVALVGVCVGLVLGLIIKK